MSIRILRVLFAASLWLMACAVHADNAFPQRPLKIIVPSTAGSAPDVLIRLLGEPLSQKLKQAVVVENRAGAGGVLGTQLFVKEKADGHTILLATSSTNAAAPHLYAKLGYDPVNDFTPVVSLCEIPNVMVVPT